MHMLLVGFRITIKNKLSNRMSYIGAPVILSGVVTVDPAWRGINPSKAALFSILAPSCRIVLYLLVDCECACVFW